MAFAGVWTGEVDGNRDNLGEYVADDLHLLTISCDPTYALRAWADAKGYFVPRLSDFWPHGMVSQQYGAFLETKGFATRATFVIDKDGIIRWAFADWDYKQRADPDAVIAAVRAIMGRP